MKDKNGRLYANFDNLKKGDRVQVDDGFNCMKPNSVHTVCGDGEDKYVECADGHHMLDGQLMTDNVSLVGIYPFANSN